jgi:hypothetical protein
LNEASSTETSIEHACKICFDAEVDVILLPCAHLCICNQCAPCLTVCPICRTRIVEAKRVFRS